MTEEKIQVVVLISANAEWASLKTHFLLTDLQESPFGPFFKVMQANKSTILFQGGWGKISAAASTQYVIDRWHPDLIINLGTCGGLADKTKVGEIFLVEKTLVYDIYERMGDPLEAINHYSTDLDLTFLSEPYPQPVRKGLLVSADQDIDPDLVHKLTGDYGAAAADWESGAIAWVAKRNEVPCLILRAVSDMVDPLGGEIYESDEFENRAETMMLSLLKALPNWIRCAFWGLGA
jgi:adenosylhomocysteine nucleosidase